MESLHAYAIMFYIFLGFFWALGSCENWLSNHQYTQKRKFVVTLLNILAWPLCLAVWSICKITGRKTLLNK